MYHYIFFICQPFRIVCIVSCIFLLFYTSGKVGSDHLLVGFKFVGKEQTFVTPMENGSTVEISCWGDLSRPSAGIKNRPKTCAVIFSSPHFLIILNRYQSMSNEVRKYWSIICLRSCSEPKVHQFFIGGSSTNPRIGGLSVVTPYLGLEHYLNDLT